MPRSRTPPALVFLLLATTACGPLLPEPAVFDERSAGSAAPALPGAEVLWVAEGGGDAARLRWEAAVGPALVIQARGDRTPDPVDSLAVVTWNTHVGGGDLDRLVDDLSTGAVNDGQPVRHFALLLQEVFRDGVEVPESIPADAKVARSIRARPDRSFRSSVEEFASRRNLHLFYVPGVRNGADFIGHEEDRGNAIVATLPLTEWTAVELPVERHRRVAAVATLHGRTAAGREWRLVLASAHLEGRSRTSRFLDSFGRGRERQMRFLLSAIPPARPAILGGDFNTWLLGAREPCVRVARERFSRPLQISTASTHRLGFLGTKLDYLLFQVPDEWEVGTRRLDDRYESDHHPLLGWIRFAPEDGS